MKKNLIFGLFCVFSFVFVLGACSSGGSSGNSNAIVLDMDITDNTGGYSYHVNTADSIFELYVLPSHTYTFSAELYDRKIWETITDADLSGTVWTLSSSSAGTLSGGTLTTVGDSATFTSGQENTTTTNLTLSFGKLRFKGTINVVSVLPQQGD